MKLHRFLILSGILTSFSFSSSHKPSLAREWVSDVPRPRASDGGLGAGECRTVAPGSAQMQSCLPQTRCWLRRAEVRERPGLAVFRGDELVGLRIGEDTLVDRVPNHLAAGAIGDVAEVGNGGDVMADAEIEHRLLP